MTQELIYTSAPRGLKPGARGFCTVACTQGMSKPLAEQLEALSGYRPIYATGDERAVDNPINYSHSILRISGNEYHVLSRVADAGFDYTQRSNKLAHHVVLNERELTDCGPAALLASPDFMIQTWAGEPQLIPAGRPAREVPLPEGKCVAWEQATGDAGWGGVLAETALSTGAEPVVVIYRAGFAPLPLVNEALSLLPTSTRWKTTFSTYFTKGSGIDCCWRFMVDDTAEAKVARRMPNARVIDLCGPLQPAEGGELVVAARTGVRSTTTSSEKSARRPQERLVQFGTAASAPASQGVPYAEEVAYGLALPDMPPLDQPSVLFSARQRETATMRRRRKYAYGAIAAVSLLLAAGMGAVTYWLKNKGDVQVGMTNPRPGVNEVQSNSNDSTRVGGDDGTTRPTSLGPAEQNLENSSIKPVEQREVKSPPAGEDGEQSAPVKARADEHQTLASESVPGLASSVLSDKAPDQSTSEQKPLLAHLRDETFQLQLPVKSAESATSYQTLRPFDFPPAADVKLSIAGIDTALNSPPLARADNFSFSVDSNSPTNLTLMRIGQDSLKVAHFRFKDGVLGFHWETGNTNETDRLTVEYLQNCILNIESGGQSHSMQLRRVRRVPFAKLSEAQDDESVRFSIGAIEMSTRQLASLKHTLFFKDVPIESPIGGPTCLKLDKSGAGILSPLKFSFPVRCDSSLGEQVLFLESWLESKRSSGANSKSAHELVLAIKIKGPVWDRDSLKQDSNVHVYTEDYLQTRIDEATYVITSNDDNKSTDKKSTEYIEKLTLIQSFCETAKTFVADFENASRCEGNVLVAIEAKAGELPIRLVTLGDADLEPSATTVERDAKP